MGNCYDAPEGRKLIESLDFKAGCHLLMDRAYEDDKTRALVIKQGLIPVIPPKKNRNTPWDYDTVLYKRRNEIERFLRFFTRYDKLDRECHLCAVGRFFLLNLKSAFSENIVTTLFRANKFCAIRL